MAADVVLTDEGFFGRAELVNGATVGGTPVGGLVMNAIAVIRSQGRGELKPERLSLVDTAWLHMEQPTNLMMVGSLAFFDEPLDRQQLLTALSRRLLQHARFREHIEAAAVGPPHWVADPAFELGAHVHRIALPAPGGDAELRDVIGDLMRSPLDMSRPLWVVHLFDNHCG